MSFIKDLLVSEQRSSIERWVREHAYGVAMPNGDTLCRVLGEYMFVVTLDDHSVAPHLVMNGYWEMWVTMCLAKRVKPGWQCIDVGANFGYYTVLLADLVGEQGKVEAWEPSVELHTRLLQTVLLSGVSERVTAARAAAGRAEGERRLVRFPHDYGGATITASYQPGLPANQEHVKQRRLATTTLERVDFVKIDAEGMEPEIWESLGDMRPEAALLEWMPEKYSSDPGKFLALLRQQGYSIGLVNQHGDVEPSPSDAPLLAIKGWQALWLEHQQ